MRVLFVAVCAVSFGMMVALVPSAAGAPAAEPAYQYPETRTLVSLVNDAASVIAAKGEAVFPEFKTEGSVWRHGETYIFILDTDGNQILHPDPAMEGKNQLGLKDVNGRPIVRSMLDLAMGAAGEGWVHYQWPEPGSITPLWKSSFVKIAQAPSGKRYIVGSGLYNMRMEKAFIVATVDAAAALLEKEGRGAFPQIRDRAGAFIFMDTYVFVDSPDGTELVNGAFPNLEGRNLIDYKDSNGDYLVRAYIDVAMTKGAGWTNYLWPKPGQTTPLPKHTYVKKVTHGAETFVVGSGAYLD